MKKTHEIIYAHESAFEEIKGLLRKDDFHGALSLCGQLPAELRNEKLTMVLKGHALWGAGDYQISEEFLEHACKQHPKTELLSLLYFQVLFEQGKKAEAQNELRRLLLLKESSIYTEIIRDYGWNKDELLNS